MQILRDKIPDTERHAIDSLAGRETLVAIRRVDSTSGLSKNRSVLTRETTVLRMFNLVARKGVGIDTLSQITAIGEILPAMR